MKRLIIFTNAFPYGNGYNWITEELKCFSNSFDEVYISPFSYEGNRIPVQVPGDIELLAPMDLDDIQYTSPWQIFRLSTSRIFYFLQEFINEKVYTSSYWFKTWLQSSLLTDKLIGSSNFKFIQDLDNKSGTTLYFYWGNNQAFLIPFLRKLNFRRIYIRFHGFDLYKERLGGYQAFKQAILQNVDTALPLSAFGQKYLHQSWPNVEFRSVISRLGTAHAGRSPQTKGDSFHIVSCARLIKLKRIELIPRSLSKIVTQKIKWTHIGDGEEMENIKVACEALPANIIVDFKGWVPADEVSKIYSQIAFDLFVSVSESEGVPVSIMEALSAGIPVLSTDVGGISELVNEQNGYLIDKEIDEQSLAKKIQDIIVDKGHGILDEKKVHAFKTFRERCDAERLAKELDELLST